MQPNVIKNAHEVSEDEDEEQVEPPKNQMKELAKWYKSVDSSP